MISYAPLWKTMEKHKATTYTLRAKAEINASTVRRLQQGESVSTNTLDALCEFFKCSLAEVVEYIPNEKREPQ